MLEAWQNKLSARWTARGVANAVFTAAVSGVGCDYWIQNGTSGQYRLRELLAQYQPDLVIVACGTNNPVDTPARQEQFGWYWRMILEVVHGWRPGNPVKTGVSWIQYSDSTLAGVPVATTPR